jgi:hypothetical protein
VKAAQPNQKPINPGLAPQQNLFIELINSEFKDAMIVYYKLSGI